MTKTHQPTPVRPAQTQTQQPGIESKMRPRPSFENADYIPAAKLDGLIALITGGDSGIGRVVAVAFALEGANVAIVYLNEHDDARVTKKNESKRSAVDVLHLPAMWVIPSFARMRSP